MTTDTSTSEIITLMTIKTASSVEGRDGPQWQLTVTWPWTVGQNAESTWINKSKYPIEPTGGQHRVAAAHRSIKKKRDGGQHDGSMPWMWNWTVLRFLDPDEAEQQDTSSHASPPAATVASGNGTPAHHQTSGASTPATYEEQKQYHINLGMAFNKAVDIVISEATTFDDADLVDLIRVRQWRDRLLAEVILTPPAPAHWCYQHETQRIQSPKTSVWGHVLADGTACTELTAPPEPAPIATKTGSSTEARTAPRGQRCPLHNQPDARMPNGRIGHPVSNREPCYADERGQPSAGTTRESATEDPDKDDLEVLQEEINATPDWTWQRFEDEILHMNWAEWLALGGTVEHARRKFQS